MQEGSGVVTTVVLKQGTAGGAVACMQRAWPELLANKMTGGQASMEKRMPSAAPTVQAPACWGGGWCTDDGRYTSIASGHAARENSVSGRMGIHAGKTFCKARWAVVTERQWGTAKSLSNRQGKERSGGMRGMRRGAACSSKQPGADVGR